MDRPAPESTAQAFRGRVRCISRGGNARAGRERLVLNWLAGPGPAPRSPQPRRAFHPASKQPLTWSRDANPDSGPVSSSRRRCVRRSRHRCRSGPMCAAPAGIRPPLPIPFLRQTWTPSCYQAAGAAALTRRTASAPGPEPRPARCSRPTRGRRGHPAARVRARRRHLPARGRAGRRRAWPFLPGTAAAEVRRGRLAPR